MNNEATATADPQRAIAEGRRIAAEGGRVVAVIGWRVPMEPIRAAGFHPVQVNPDLSLPTPDADALLSPEAQPPLRALLQTVLGGTLAFAELIVFAPPHAPVSVQIEELRRLGLIAENVPPTYYFETTMLRGDQQRSFAIERTRDLARRMAALAGRPLAAADLESQIADSNRVRRTASSLLAARDGADAPAGSMVIAALGEADWLAPADHAAQLEKLLADTGAPATGPRLLLISSSVLGNARLHALVEESGANIVAEDDIYGSCHADREIAENSGDPLAAIGSFYHDNQPAQRTSPLELRRRWFHEQLARDDIDGVVFYAEDPLWGWDVPAMRKAAADADKPTVTVSLDVRLPEKRAAAAEQLKEFVQALAQAVSA